MADEVKHRTLGPEDEEQMKSFGDEMKARMRSRYLMDHYKDKNTLSTLSADEAIENIFDRAADLSNYILYLRRVVLKNKNIDEKNKIK